MIVGVGFHGWFELVEPINREMQIKWCNFMNWKLLKSVFSMRNSNSSWIDSSLRQFQVEVDEVCVENLK